MTQGVDNTQSSFLIGVKKFPREIQIPKLFKRFIGQGTEKNM